MPSEPNEKRINTACEALDAIFPRPWQVPVLLAVSGGADSMALLHLLHRGGCPVAVAHFDHQTRDGASGAEGDFVAEVAAGLGVPMHRGGGDITALAEASTESFEMAARRARYAFLVETAQAHGYAAIVTGHHADDQSETVLMRLLRGTSPTGLAGIPGRRSEGGIPLLRPLLGIARANLVAWLCGEGLSWREDESNKDQDILRNKIRHELLPALRRDYNPRIDEALNRLARIQRREDSLLARLAVEAWVRCRDSAGRIDRQTFIGLDEALQHRVMTEIIQSGGGDASYDTVCRGVELLTHGKAGKQIDVGNEVALFRGDGHGVIAPLRAEGMEQNLPLPGEATVGRFHFRCKYLAQRPEGVIANHCNPRCQLFDGATLGDHLMVRTRRTGDRFQPMGMAGTKKLKDYFNDLGLTRAERDRQLLVVRGDEIIWVVGHNISGAVAVTGDTTTLVEIEIVRPL
ncbi:MAG: tRNA lysidine(34) synthetase TilS [Candidatus Hydrogenedentes bacterium]|nr:tRNA lysidine(34) synthetase TilS [Candidatus Hydrogenedentota bacterium]